MSAITCLPSCSCTFVPCLTLELSFARRWFRSTDPKLGWCGEIDASPYMPADIFQPRHFLNLVAYAELTISTYINPNERATALVLGQCSGIGYSNACTTASCRMFRGSGTAGHHMAGSAE